MRIQKTIEEFPITGIIIANEWDLDGNATDVVIYADDEEVYWVKKGPIQDLLNAIKKRVRIIGKSAKLANGRKQIDIKSFNVIEDTDQGNQNLFFNLLG